MNVTYLFPFLPHVIQLETICHRFKSFIFLSFTDVVTDAITSVLSFFINLYSKGGDRTKGNL